jgi:uncharacterized protein YjbI with pentapeptide repeats
MATAQTIESVKFIVRRLDRRKVLAALSLALGLAAASDALAFQCAYDPPPGRALATADEVVEFVVEGEEEIGEGACAANARVLKAIKGGLRAGDTFQIAYEPDGSCGGAFAVGSPRLENFYADRNGRYDLAPCGGNVSDAVIRAYLTQRRELALAAAKLPGSFAAQARLTQFLVGWDDQPAALDAVEAASALAPGNEDIALLRARLTLRTSRGEPAKLARAIDELRPLAPTNSAALLFLAKATIWQARSIEMQGAKTRPKDRPPQPISGLSDLTGADMTGEAFSSVVFAGISAPNSDWTASALVDLDISNARFDGAIFTQAILDQANFADTSLVRTKFAGASIVGTDFSRAGLQLANLRDVTAYGAKFAGADLRAATVGGIFENGDFTGADLRGADLRGAYGNGISWTGARIDCATRLHRSIEPATVGMIVEGNCPDGGQAAK